MKFDGIVQEMLMYKYPNGLPYGVYIAPSEEKDYKYIVRHNAGPLERVTHNCYMLSECFDVIDNIIGFERRK